MRNQQEMINSFMPTHEKEWEARLLVDKAIKGQSEYQLEAIARALSGKNEIKFEYEAPLNKPTFHVCGDDGTWIKETKQFKISAKMGSYCFYANTKAGIWLEIIKFWIEKESVFPCGAVTEL